LAGQNKLECPQDRKPVERDKWHRIFGHDIYAMMTNISKVIKKHKNDASTFKTQLESQDSEMKKLNKKLDRKKRKLEETQQEKEKLKQDLEHYKQKFSIMVAEKDEKMKKINK
jgi:predicted  nucleic acid-binding Zn-ribbon protein